MREIDQIVRNMLTSNGFVLKRNSWYRITDDLIQIINFQKSYFSNKFYLNIGIDERFEQKIIYKPEYHFPIRLRIESLLSDSQLLQALDFDLNFSESDRLENLHTIILHCVNFLNDISNWEQLTLAINDKFHPIHKAAITGAFMKRLKNN